MDRHDEGNGVLAHARQAACDHGLKLAECPSRCATHKLGSGWLPLAKARWRLAQAASLRFSSHQYSKFALAGISRIDVGLSIPIAAIRRALPRSQRSATQSVKNK